VETPCGRVVLRRPGYAVTVAGPNECPSDPELASRQEIREALSKLTSGPGQSGGGTFTGDGPTVTETFDGGPNNPPEPPGPPRDLEQFIQEQAQDPFQPGGSQNNACSYTNPC
jgi:hypothetical protein